MVRPNSKFSRVHVANGRTNIISRCKSFFDTSTSFDEINIVSDIKNKANSLNLNYLRLS